jgi:hypothetical protein
VFGEVAVVVAAYEAAVVDVGGAAVGPVVKWWALNQAGGRVQPGKVQPRPPWPSRMRVVPATRGVASKIWLMIVTHPNRRQPVFRTTSRSRPVRVGRVARGIPMTADSSPRRLTAGATALTSIACSTRSPGRNSRPRRRPIEVAGANPVRSAGAFGFVGVHDPVGPIEDRGGGVSGSVRVGHADCGGGVEWSDTENEWHRKGHLYLLDDPIDCPG